MAHCNLGSLLQNEQKDVDGAEAAYRAAIAADPGYAKAHCNLGILPKNERNDVHGAEAAYRKAIAADPGYALAHSNLGALSQRAQSRASRAAATWAARRRCGTKRSSILPTPSRWVPMTAS